MRYSPLVLFDICTASLGLLSGTGAMIFRSTFPPRIIGGRSRRHDRAAGMRVPKVGIERSLDQWDFYLW